MIHTESICYVSDTTGRLTPVNGMEGAPMKFFVSAPDMESVRGLLRFEIALPVPMLFITRQTAPANDFQI